MNTPSPDRPFWAVHVLVWLGWFVLMIIAEGWFGRGETLYLMAALMGLVWTLVSLIDSVVRQRADSGAGEHDGSPRSPSVSVTPEA